VQHESCLMMPMIRPLAMLLTLALVSAAPQAAGKKHAVSIEDMKFNPSSLRIAKGDTVIWTNNDDRDHNVVADNGAFNSDTIPRGEKFTHTFNATGRYPYSCTLHPRMKGVIVVE
jgi:plastocyanin